MATLLLGALLLATETVDTAAAQKPPPPRAGPLEALRACAPWPSDKPVDQTIAPPTDLQATYIEEGRVRRVRVTWRDAADNEACYGVLETASVPPRYLPEGETRLITVTLADRTETSTLPPPGRACYRVYAGSSTGHSALSNEACVDVPAPPVPGPEARDPCSERSVENRRDIITVVGLIRPQAVRQLTDEVLAVAFRGPGGPEPQVRLWHEATGSEVTLRADGVERSRIICDPRGEQAIAVVLNDPDRSAQALALVRELPPLGG